MITIASYILLNYYVGTTWSGWLMVMPVLLDFVIINKLDRR